MIDIKRKEDCCGCNACGDVCAHQAITFKTDIEGFWYPEVDKDKCIDCGLCEKVCPIIHSADTRKGNDDDPTSYILQNKNVDERFNSTSGCLYPIIAQHVFNKGGWVAGHIFNEDYSVKNYITNNPTDLQILRNSKYLQSNLQGFFKQIKKKLIEGEYVLASGCPCQMAALKTFLRKDYPNLITVDFTCMGIDTPLAFRKYLDSLEEIYNSKVSHFKSKCKEVGWRRLANKVIFENGKTYFGVNGKDANLNATFLDILVRPSCYDCKFKGKQRISDISIGDFWNPNHKFEYVIDDNSGTSYIMLNNDKAKSFFNEIDSLFISKETTADTIIKGNRHAVSSLPHPTFDRKEFYNRLQTERFDKLVESYRASQTLPLRYRLSMFKKIAKFNNWNLISSFRCLYYNLFNSHICSNLWNGDILLFDGSTKFKFDSKSHINIKGVVPLSKNALIELGESSCLKLDNAQLVGNNIHIKLWRNAQLSIGYLTTVLDSVSIEAMDKVIIGDFCHMGKGVDISDSNNLVLITSDNAPICKSVNIGTHCLLKQGVVIQKGTVMSDEVIANEYSVVGGFVAPRRVIQGNPAAEIDKNIYWKNNS